MSLENRRIRSDLIETYEIINDYYNIDASIFFQFDECGKRGHSKKLHKDIVGEILGSMYLPTGLQTSGTQCQMHAQIALR